MKETAFKLLADLGDLDVLRPTVAGAAKSARMAMSDVLLLVGALLAITLLLILAVTLWMKSRRHHHHHHHRSRSETQTVEASSTIEENDDESPGHRHRRRRKRRRDHRHLNPTLAETGGLPPIREGPPPSV